MNGVMPGPLWLAIASAGNSPSTSSGNPGRKPRTKRTSRIANRKVTATMARQLHLVNLETRTATVSVGMHSGCHMTRWCNAPTRRVTPVHDEKELEK